MGTLFQQICFFAALVGVGIVLWLRIGRIKSNIMLGKAYTPTGNPDARMKNMLLTAMGQKKMFERPIVGLLHLAVYAGFLLINMEVLEIVLDGLTGKHRIFAGLFGAGFYAFLVSFFEITALVVVAACVAFLARRNILRLKRFWSAEMTSWPRSDANIILIWEITLMFFLYTMNAADSILQTRAAESAYLQSHFPMVGDFAVSQFLIPLYDGLSTTTLMFLERLAWWIHILGIMGFAVYVTFSKHLHIGLAFPNTYFAEQQPKGEMRNMAEITKEVNIMLGKAQPDETPAEIGRFGAKDVVDLTWKQLLEAYSCTECGRCTSVCPANQTGKKLSPRKIMMDTRDRADELGDALAKYGKDHQDGKYLYGDYVSKEELMACTTCNACAEACPININPLAIILEMRRYVAMEESGTPAAWNSMFANIESSAAPWAFAASDRFNWAKQISEK